MENAATHECSACGGTGDKLGRGVGGSLGPDYSALARRCLATIATGALACLRCGGSGIYAHYGRCFRCGGVGRDPHQPKNPAKSRTLARQRAYAESLRCPVCLGSGRISDVRTARDAMVDAETLNEGWWSGPDAPPVHEPLVAADYGMRAAHRITMGWESESNIVWHARMAARAAFRAVPALRGEA